MKSLKPFCLCNSIYAHGWSPERKLNSLSSSNILSISRIKELNFFTYSRTDPSCLNFFKSSLAIQDMLLGRNCSSNSCFRISYVSTFGFPALRSSLDIVRYHNFASPVRYIIAMFTYSSKLILATLKYCSMSHKKVLQLFGTSHPIKWFQFRNLRLKNTCPNKSVFHVLFQDVNCFLYSF